MVNIIICVFGCVTVEKYKLQVQKINETWGARAKKYNNIKIRFFLGEEKVNEFTGEEYVYLPDVKNDYISASFKQNLGLKYIYDNYKDIDFVFVCGTDTYVNVDKLNEFLQDYNPKDKLYIGGHTSEEKINKKMTLKFHLGGAGFILSKKSLSILSPLFGKMVEDWIKICEITKNEKLKYGCDVCIAYYTRILNIQMVTFHDRFYECNYRGLMDVSHINGFFSVFNCCSEHIQWKDIITCHNMSLRDFDDFTNILDQEKWYLGE